MFQEGRRDALWSGWDLFLSGKAAAMQFCVAVTGCVVPMHREISRGTLRGILEQAGVSAEEFMAAL